MSLAEPTVRTGAGGEVGSVAAACEEVTRRFGRRWALRGVTLAVNAGEVVGIEGHNGSGKSTLLKIFATSLRATSGVVTVFGHSLPRDADWVRARIAWMGYSPGLYDDLTARENLRFACDMLGHGWERLDDILAEVGLTTVSDERVRTFSSGMQRRLALGRLLLQQPRLLLLDEPYASLDREAVQLVNRVISRVVDAGGAALVVLHDRHQAAGVLHRVATMRSGRLEGPVS